MINKSENRMRFAEIVVLIRVVAPLCNSSDFSYETESNSPSKLRKIVLATGCNICPNIDHSANVTPVLVIRFWNSNCPFV